jgi:vacuolar-type H+-ATPase subunit I/STV1
MTDKPVKERLAEILAGDYCPHWFYEENMDEIVVKLRRQYEEIEALQQDVKKFREAAFCEREVRRQLERIVEADEALLRQALEALVINGSLGLTPAIQEAITAIKERLA